MKKKTLAYIIILILIGVFGFYYSYNTGFHNYYSIICGSGIYGFKPLMVNYLMVLIIIIAVVMTFKYLKPIKKCRHCKIKIDKEFKTCPNCGNSIGEDSGIL